MNLLGRPDPLICHFVRNRSFTSRRIRVSSAARFPFFRAPSVYFVLTKSKVSYVRVVITIIIRISQLDSRNVRRVHDLVVGRKISMYPVIVIIVHVKIAFRYVCTRTSRLHNDFESTEITVGYRSKPIPPFNASYKGKNVQKFLYRN